MKYLLIIALILGSTTSAFAAKKSSHKSRRGKARVHRTNTKSRSKSKSRTVARPPYKPNIDECYNLVAIAAFYNVELIDQPTAQQQPDSTALAPTDAIQELKSEFVAGWCAPEDVFDRLVVEYTKALNITNLEDASPSEDLTSSQDRYTLGQPIRDVSFQAPTNYPHRVKASTR